MTATLMRGTDLAARIRAEVAEEVKELGTIGLATVQVGDDEASSIYLGRKRAAAAEAAGIRTAWTGEADRPDARLRGSGVLAPEVDRRGLVVANLNRREPDRAELPYRRPQLWSSRSLPHISVAVIAETETSKLAETGDPRR